MEPISETTAPQLKSKEAATYSGIRLRADFRLFEKYFSSFRPFG